MRHYYNPDPPETNPAFDADVLDKLSVVDGHVRKQNGHQIPVEMQFLLLPMWSLKCRMLDLNLPLKDVIKRYSEMKEKMTEVAKCIEKGEAELPEFQLIFNEIQLLYNAYLMYSTQLKSLRCELLHHLNMYSAHSENIWNNMSNLSIIDENECRTRAYCLKVSMQEYANLEMAISESSESSQDILKCSVAYLMAILKFDPVVTEKINSESLSMHVN